MRVTPKVQPAKDTTAWFYCTMLYLLIVYGRPQDLLPMLGAIRPGLLINLVLIGFLVKNRALIVRRNKQIRMIWYFIGLLGLLVPFARNNFYAYTTFTDMLRFVPFILSAVVCIDSVARLRIFIKFYVGLMVYIALYALMHGGIGSGNYFGDENDVSLYLNMVIPFCYFMFIVERHVVTRVFYLAALTIGLFAVVASFSRGGFIGLAAVFFVVWIVSPRKILTVFATLILATIVYFYSSEEYRSEMATSTDTSEGTARARLMSWASAWDMFIDNPLGVGGNNFQVLFPEYQGDRFSRGMWGRVAHSLWFTLIPELGIIGIVIYLRLLFYNLKDIFSIRSRARETEEIAMFFKSLSAAFFASLAGFFASGTFVSVLYYPHYWYMTAIIVATARIPGAIGGDGSTGGRTAIGRPTGKTASVR